MSYDLPTKKYSISADVDSLATFLAQRQSDSGTTNGGIVATGSPTVPHLGVDALGLGLAYFKGMADAFLAGAAIQLESNNVLSTNSTTSTSFVDVPGTSITFTAPFAKTYSVHCDFSMFQSAGTAPSTPQLRLVINGNNGPSIWATIASSGIQVPFHLMHSAACAAGSNTIKLQWLAVSTTTLAVNSNSYANYIVSG